VADGVVVRGVWKRYSRSRPRVLRGVDLTVDAGTVHVVVGGNGSGKSTLLRVAAGASVPSRGTVRRPASVAYVPERLPADQRLTARHYLSASLLLPVAVWLGVAVADAEDPVQTAITAATAAGLAAGAAAHVAVAAAGTAIGTALSRPLVTRRPGWWSAGSPPAWRRSSSRARRRSAGSPGCSRTTRAPTPTSPGGSPWSPRRPRSSPRRSSPRPTRPPAGGSEPRR
jgi:energy-coupling factor transporter ATP-binding protein EcfA2